MAVDGWSQLTFRLRKIPGHLTTTAEVTSLLSAFTGLPKSQIVAFSVATACDALRDPPTKVATVRFLASPDSIKRKTPVREGEWRLTRSSGAGELLLDSHFEGLTPLNDVATSEHMIDCIAVSGLASHPFGSWQSRTKNYMWLRDGIPNAIPGVRTILYGFDSALVASRSFQSISDIAQRFLLHLKLAGWHLPASKPTVFLGHSLGGLVLKDAMVQSAGSRDAAVAALFQRLRGALMFGVPNLGMDNSHWGPLVEGRPNEILVQNLSRANGTSFLRQLDGKFQELAVVKKAAIYWAYETLESPTVKQLPDGTWSRSGPPVLLVNPASATCNWSRKDKSRTIPIDGDHSTMVKFSLGDPDLGIVMMVLSKICSSV
ncbi:hypothetical protein QBC47DRAFT_392355 [Echria macrotheca]|uniref:Uncharacterized protein n=1 Tax=Echria macrotheca TaxID=438768 RepID=A0AAJ0B6M7_9PEZI|nr:hypothetical protein QBC47DRAFT_392355 [Echria macrotheca]